MSRITEKQDVQNSLVHYLRGIDWTYLPPLDVEGLRGRDEAQPFLAETLRSQLIALNKGLVTEKSASEILRRLTLLPPTLLGNEEYTKALRGQWTVYDEVAKRERNLTLIDYDNIGKNTFHFTQELPVQGHDRRRIDMVLWINGLPVIVIENKSPTVQNAHFEAFDQVQNTYTDRIPDFIKYPPVMVACNMGLHYAPTWNNDTKAMNTWKVKGKDYGLERLSKSFLNHEQVLKLIRDYTVFFREDDQTQKYLLRPHQMRSIEKIGARVLDSRDKAGLHWHTQGSGKTLTMIIAANVLRRELSARKQNPTLVIVIDRRELESQMAQNLEAYGFPAVVQARSKSHLQELLSSDYRGLIVTLIHKFDRIPKDLMTRENVVVLIDEAHRSQEGDLGTYMRAALPNAFYFGFTGTPIDRGQVGRGTFETFGKPDAPQGYQDKYGMAESIEDETTVPLYYTIAPADIQVDKETLEEEFNQVVEEQGAASIEAINAILKRADKLNAVMKAPERVEKIARHVAEHFQSNVMPLGFKAFLVAIDREGCALYKEALDKYLPVEMSRVVYTPYHKDDELLRQYHLDEDLEKQLRKDFRRRDRDPQILIVTEKLLTGYNAPILYAMYLDKPLRDHTLLQAIARVNRPYPDKKSGLIIDYIGIFENLQKALSFDGEEVATGLIDIEELKKHFVKLFDEVQTLLSEIDLSATEGRSERIIDYFFDEEPREEFIEQFKSLQNAYEVLSPDPFLRDYIDDYALIAQVYQVVYNKFSPEAERKKLEREILNKTDALIRENVEAHGKIDTLPLYPIDKDLAKVVKADNVGDRVKVTNLHQSILTHIEQHQETQLYLISLGEEVEGIIRKLKERQISVEAALAQLQEKGTEIAEAQEEQKKSDLDNVTYALYFVLKGQSVDEPKETANQIYQLLQQYPGWPYNDRLEQRIHQKIYPILRPVMPGKGAARLVEVAESVLRVAKMVSQ